MRTRKALNLRSDKDLKSNSLEDIRNELRLLYKELDSQWRLMFQDVSTIQLDTDGFLYGGNKDTDGSWRIGRIGADWVLQHRDSGTWTTVELSSGT